MKATARIYVLWAEGTSRFKVGYTSRSVGSRALEIEAASPFPLHIVGSRTGTKADEQQIHRRLRRYRVQREWFALPEPAVWWLVRWFGLKAPDGQI